MHTLITIENVIAAMSDLVSVLVAETGQCALRTGGREHLGARALHGNESSQAVP